MNPNPRGSTHAGNAGKRPLLSVVIPTSGRPQFLPQAVESALASAPVGEVEVIVVPNGGDISWKASLEQYREDSRLRILPIPTPHANAARNHGMRSAAGRFIRFLDDDDLLYPAQALRQCLAAEAGDVDVCSGDLEFSDDAHMVYGAIRVDRTTTDFTTSTCSRRRLAQMTAHLFKLDTVRDIPWDESIPYGQIACWMLDLVAARELKWSLVEEAVGCYHRHTGARISTSASWNRKQVFAAERLMRVSRALADRDALSMERREAIADGLWHRVHRAFCFAPRYWLSVALWTRRFHPQSRCAVLADLSRLTRNSRLTCDPLLATVLLAPAKAIEYYRKSAAQAMGLSNRW